jgi:hypothetical protein
MLIVARRDRRFASQRDFGQASGAKPFRGVFRQRLPALFADSHCVHISAFYLSLHPIQKIFAAEVTMI